VGLYFRHPLSFDHDTGAHPENAERIRAIEDRLERDGWHGAEVLEAPAATVEQLERVHPRAHIEAIEAISAAGGGMLDLDTVASGRSYDAARRAAGGAAAAAERLLSGEDRFAFCGLRPPGHHAERSRAMGFCLFNNVAVAAAHALESCGARRVMIVDWDVHHGNGTQDVFYSSADVLFVSIHQSPLYPGSGDPGETGMGEGAGYTLNLPVAPGAGPDDFLSLIQHLIVDVGRRFAPDLLAVSAGYDAHRADPLAQCLLDGAAYADMAASLRDLAAELEVGVLVCLEGGYATEALAESVSATISAFSDPSVKAREAPVEPAAEHRRGLPVTWSQAG
jgi:acetoin utilization deacetylase AcuC-like enzyme